MLSTKSHLVALVAVLLAGMVLSPLSIHVIPSVPTAHAVNRSITLIGNPSHLLYPVWNSSTNSNPTITVVANDVVLLSLSSADGLTHQFFIDVDHNAIRSCAVDKCAPPVPPSNVYNFTVNFQPGTYEYYCFYHPDSMVGTFTVNAPVTIGGTPVPVDKLGLVAPYAGLSLLGLALVAAIIHVRHQNKKQ